METYRMDVESKCSHLESVYFETMIRQPEEKYDPSSFMKTEYFLQNGINFSHASLRRRRSRTNFSSWQLLRLESTFQRHHYPDVHACQDLTKELGLSGSTVQVWFQNRRAKWRRQENTRRGPGRPSSSAPRISCSGDPLSTEEIVRKILQKGLRKKQTNKDSPDYTQRPSPKQYDWSTEDKHSSIEEKAIKSKSNETTDFISNQEESVLDDREPPETQTREPSIPVKHHHFCPQNRDRKVTRHLPFNIENLLST